MTDLLYRLELADQLRREGYSDQVIHYFTEHGKMPPDLDEFKIGNITWTLSHKETINDDEELFGLCDANKNIIYIKKDLPTDKKRQVILHEIIHAVMTEMEEEQTESFVNVMSLFLDQILSQMNLYWR